jgi:gamma-glutamyltranspeptidase/glutathione hydrolase
MFTTRPELKGTFGMVASTHWIASGAGMATLENGGNAFDAAVAAGLVLQVVEPHLNGPGGEVPILIYSAEREEVVSICGQGTAPARLSADHFAALELDLIPGTGLLPACVPGAFGAWMLLLRDYGRLRLADVIKPAIYYAERGYPMLERISATIAGVEDLFRREWTTSADVYLAGEGPPRAGALWRNNSLARTYHRLLSEAEAAGDDRQVQIEAARRIFYEGFVAEAIDAFSASSEVLDSSGRRHKGVLEGDDLARWQPTVEKPVSFEYLGYRVFKAGSWCQGPVFLQQLALLDHFDLTSMGHNSADYIHTVVECAKLAFADREGYYGDPDFADVPLGDLLSNPYARARSRLVRERASLDLRPGSVNGGPRLPDFLSGPAPRPDAPVGAGDPTLDDDRGAVARDSEVEGRGDTCHIDVVDGYGNMVSATPSGGWLQSSPVIPELGFPLGTRGQMFWLERGLPNSLEPGKRPRTTLSPSLASKHDRPYLVFGTPGGDQQDQWTLNAFLSHVHFGLDLQEAIDAPNFHTTHFPSSFYPRESRPGGVSVEARLDPDVIAELRARGHEVTVEGPWSLGRVSAAARDPETGLLKAGANPRGMQGYAVGR